MGILFIIPPINSGQLRSGRIEVNGGCIVEVCLPQAWDPMQDGALRKAWLEQAGQQHVKLAWAPLPQIPRVAVLFQLVPGGLSVERRVARQMRLAHDVVRSACHRAGVDPSESILNLDWTTLKILGFELACAFASVVVVDDVGLDPLGERRFLAHISERLRDPGVGVIALRHGKRIRAFPWTDSCVAIDVLPECVQ